MHLQDHVTQFIQILKNIKSSLLKFENTQYKKTVSYLELAIKSLEDYKASQGQFVPKPPTHLSNLQKKTTSQKQKPVEKPSGQQFPQCESGKHWVRFPMKNGEPGYCRRNRQKRKN